jgi:glycosyltransferase involved in cell wall biosynthesis
MKLSIIISTYQRTDNSTPFYLKRALDCVFNQTHEDFKVYVIGDKYEDNEEFINICKSYDKDKLYFENLPFAKERDRYGKGYALWSYGGVNAVNYGIDKSLDDGNYYICHLDHDDVWEPNHLEVINKCLLNTNADWVCTKSTYLSPEKTMPKIIGIENHYINFLPSYATLIHSSVCMNFNTIPFKYRDLFDETGVVGLPSDGELWNRCREHILKNNLKSYLINSITCHHDEEGFERN